MVQTVPSSSDSACSDSVTTPMTWHEEEFFGTVSPVKLYQPYATHVGEVLLCRKDIQALSGGVSRGCFVDSWVPSIGILTTPMAIQWCLHSATHPWLPCSTDHSYHHSMTQLHQWSHGESSVRQEAWFQKFKSWGKLAEGHHNTKFLYDLCRAG